MQHIDTHPACADLFLNAILPEEEARIREALLRGAGSMVRRLGNKLEDEVISHGLEKLLKHCRKGGKVLRIEGLAFLAGQNIARDWLRRQNTADRNRPGYIATQMHPTPDSEESFGTSQVARGALASLSPEKKRKLIEMYARANEERPATAAERQAKRRLLQDIAKAAAELEG